MGTGSAEQVDVIAAVGKASTVEVIEMPRSCSIANSRRRSALASAAVTDPAS